MSYWIAPGTNGLLAGVSNLAVTLTGFELQHPESQEIRRLIREGTVRRVTVLRNDRVLVDIPLVAGVPLGLILATQMPLVSAVIGVGALLGGCTLRIERDEPSA